MKAVVLTEFGSVENFTLQQLAQPVGGANDVVVRIKASAFNPIDYQMRQGSSESKLLHSPVLGRECAGVVTAVGQNVKGFSIGDEVVAYVGSLGSNGTYAEYISIPGQLVALKPGNISFQQACAVPLVGLTALQCYERLQLRSSYSICIAGGAGGVGTMLIKLLLHKGIDSFVTTAGSSESRSHLLNLGVKQENILSYKEANFLQNLLEHNGHRLYDYIIDLVGGSMSEVCSQVVKINGHYADITGLVTLKARELLFDKGITVVNISNYAYSLIRQSPYLNYYGEKLTYLMKLLERGKITSPPVEVVGDLAVESVKRAHLLLENNGTKGKKLVMRIPD